MDAQLFGKLLLALSVFFRETEQKRRLPWIHFDSLLLKQQMKGMPVKPHHVGHHMSKRL
ncbi:hypothetical protein D3C81_1977650 [compost metagenome]